MSLTQVYYSAEQPKVDIVFVHDVDTWTSGSFRSSGLVPEILTPVRVLSYGYSASHDTFTDTLHTQAEHLASALAENRKVCEAHLRESLHRYILLQLTSADHRLSWTAHYLRRPFIRQPPGEDTFTALSQSTGSTWIYR